MSRRVFPVGINTSVDDAVALMSAHQVEAAPVIDDDGRLVGLVTVPHLQLAGLERDLHPVRASLRAIRRRPQLMVGDVMRTPVASLTPGADIHQAAQFFTDRTVDCLLIVDGFTIAGIIWRHDVPG